MVSFQVSKTEYGEKVVKPLVNLHVTPNENIIHKVSKLFQKKPLLHEHYHHHDHYHPEVHYAPEYHDFHDNHEHIAPVHIPPSGFENHYHPHLHGFENNFHPEPYNPQFTSPSGFGASGYGDQLYQPPGSGYGYERSSNASMRFEDDGKEDNTAPTAYAGDYQDYKRAGKQLNDYHTVPTQAPGKSEGGNIVKFPSSRRRRSIEESSDDDVKGREKVTTVTPIILCQSQVMRVIVDITATIDYDLRFFMFTFTNMSHPLASILWKTSSATTTM